MVELEVSSVSVSSLSNRPAKSSQMSPCKMYENFSVLNLKKISTKFLHGWNEHQLRKLTQRLGSASFKEDLWCLGGYNRLVACLSEASPFILAILIRLPLIAI